MDKLCVFSGTTEGRELVKQLCGRGAQIVVCTATEYGGDLNGSLMDVQIHAGRMNASEMADFLTAEHFTFVVDATHPYAQEASENIRHACQQTHTEYLRLLRKSGTEKNDGVFVADAAACAAYLKSTQGTILLTTGTKDLPAFCTDEALRRRLYARVLPLKESLDACAAYGIEPGRIIAMQGPFEETLNTALLRSLRARYLVTKDTGSAGGYESKIRAARAAGAQAVIIGRPVRESGLTAEEILRLLEERCHLAPVQRQVFLVGMGMGNEATRTLGAQRALEAADCLIGSSRMLEAVELPEKACHEAVRADDIVQFIQSDSVNRKFAVLLSGDTGFFSGAKKLMRALEGMDMQVLPGVGSQSYFCAQLARSWEDVYPISLHGRSANLVQAVRTHAAVFALLGGENGAAQALHALCEAGFGHLPAHVGERLGYADERITNGSVDALSRESYDALSVLLVENPSAGDAVTTHGLDDEAFERGDVPMTKSEVRGVSLSKLALTEKSVVFDVGCGSGSVAVEAAMQAPSGSVYAIDMKEDAALLTERNRQKFGLSNLHVICGKAPDALAALPAPTHVFIGGSCGSLRGIIRCVLEKNPHVRIVANAVTLETITELNDIAKDFAWREAVQISVAKGRSVGAYHLMTAQNPVFIFTLQNKGDN